MIRVASPRTSSRDTWAHGIEAQQTDAFVRVSIEDHAEEVVAAVAEHRAALVNSLKTPDKRLAMVEHHNITETVAALRTFMNKM